MSEEPGQDFALIKSEIEEELVTCGVEWLRVGDVFISGKSYEGYVRVEGFTIYETKDGNRYPKVILSETWDGVKWSGGHERSIDEFAKYVNARHYKRYIKIDCTPEEHLRQSLAAAEDLDALNPFSDMVPSDDTSLVPVSSQAFAERMIEEINSRQLQVEAIQRAIQIKAERIKDIVRQMTSTITYLSEIVGLFELYLGVYEEIVQIRDGQAAPKDEPIAFRQLILYWDEEMGDPRKRNDFKAVDDFDRWVSVPEHLEIMLPERKGVVAIQPSRQQWYYDEHPWVNARENAKNRMTYLLIRNGDKLYRIWTGTVIAEKLFPGPDEVVLERSEMRSRLMPKQDEKQIRETYRKQILLLQGILDRTPVLQPMAHPVKLPDPDTYGDLIHMIYDADNVIEDGHERFKDWRRRINDAITYGSRVIIAYEIGVNHGYDRESRASRFMRYYSDPYRAPPWPKQGIYTVEKVIEEKHYYSKEHNHPMIYYNPRDTIYSSSWSWVEPHERKHRVGFKLERGDDFILHYDPVSLEDIEYFLQSRQDRKDYRSMMKFLYELRDQLIEEKEYEGHLVAMIVEELGCSENAVWSAIEWWKTKNKWQRPIRQDDAKAWRMIRKRLRRKQKQ